MYHWKGIMEPASSRPKARKRGSLKREKALRPKASTTLIGVPRAWGGVGGRTSARPAAASAVPAAQAKINGDVSKFLTPRTLMPIIIPDAGNFNTCYAAEDGSALFRANRNKCGWTKLWRSYAFALSACCKCPDFWCVEADISVKDAWGRKDWTSDPLGRSIAVVRGTEMQEAFNACGFTASSIDPCEVAQMQKPQLEYKLDSAKDKLHRPLFSISNIRNGHFLKSITAWLSRFLYAHVGVLAVACVLKFAEAISGKRKKGRSIK